MQPGSEVSNNAGKVLTAVLVTVCERIEIHHVHAVERPYVKRDHRKVYSLTHQDYYPFGMLMPGRLGALDNTGTFVIDGDGNYRYGYNAQERDDEIYGEGNVYAFTFRMHDARIVRFMSVDPLVHKYPWYSPYQFAGNTPIWARELEGLEPWFTNEGTDASALTKNDQGSYNTGSIQPDKFGPYSHEYAESKGYLDKPAINIPNVVISVGEGYNSINGAHQMDMQLNPQNYHTDAYSPATPRTPDQVGINFNGSFLYGGGASSGFGVHWVRNEGLVFTGSIGGGVGMDTGPGANLSWGYSRKGPEASNISSFTGTNLGGTLLGVSHSRDLTLNEKTGKYELGTRWHGYQLGLGLKAGSVQVSHTKGVSLKSLLNHFSAPKDYNIH